MFQNLRFPHSSPKYFTSEIRHNIKCIHSKKRLLKRHYSSSLAHKVQIMESELQQRIKNAQITYINSLISSFSSKPRSLYSHLSHLKRSSSLPCILKHEDKTTSHPLGKAILFNNYFNSVFTLSDFILPPRYALSSNTFITT